MLATLCVSHTPLMRLGPAAPETVQAVEAGFKRLAAFVERFEPDLVVQFSPDHYNGFHYKLMPPFCLGVEAHSVGDYNTPAGPLNVPNDAATSLARALIADNIDLPISLRMAVDHGFTQIWNEMFASITRFPIIPIFVNCAAPPLPPYRRARKLGEAVGRWALSRNQRILIVASGGLSHDPPFPSVWTAPAEVRERLIDPPPPTPQSRAQHVERVCAAAEAAARGEGPCLPLSRAWDEDVMARFTASDLASFDAFDPDQVASVGGRGGNEILCWLAAFAAQAAAGRYETTREFYEPIDGWIAGMAMMTALPRPA